MAYFDFSDLLSKYAAAFTVVVPGEGQYDDTGEWQAKQESRQEKTGAIVGFRESKLVRPEGTVTAKDKRLFLDAPLEAGLLGATVLYKGQRYQVESETENGALTGVFSYYLKWCSKFDRGGEGHATATGAD